MSFYFFMMSSPAGRAIRLITGTILVVVGVLGDRHGSLTWLLIVPGMLWVLGALLDLNPLAIFFGLPLIGSELRNRIHSAQAQKNGLGRLTFVGDSLQHGSDTHRGK